MDRAVAIAFGAGRIALVDSLDTSDTPEKTFLAAADALRPAPELFCWQLEVGEAASIDTAVTEIHSRWGHVDILTNATRHISPLKMQRQYPGANDIDAWWKTWEVGVKDAFVFARVLLPVLLNGPEKTIVNVFSTRSPLLQSTSGAHDLSELAVMHLSKV